MYASKYILLLFDKKFLTSKASHLLIEHLSRVLDSNALISVLFGSNPIKKMFINTRNEINNKIVKVIIFKFFE